MADGISSQKPKKVNRRVPLRFVQLNGPRDPHGIVTTVAVGCVNTQQNLASNSTLPNRCNVVLERKEDDLYSRPSVHSPADRIWVEERDDLSVRRVSGAQFRV